MPGSRTALLLAAAAISLGGCCKSAKQNDTGGLVAETGIPQVPAQINFGNVALGQALQAQLPLINAGTGTLDITQQTASGPPFSEPTPLQIASLPAGANTHAIVQFAPTQAGPASGTITLSGDGDPASVTVALVGVGLDLSVSAAPTSLAFGPVAVGSSAPTQTVTLKNTSSVALFVTVSTSGTAPEYAVTDPQGKAVAGSPVQLAVNGSYVMTVGFTPDTASIFNSAFNFTVCQTASTSACLAAQQVSLSGQGVASQLAFTPNPIVFSNVPDGTTSSVTVTLTNTGGAGTTGICVYLESVGPSACWRSSSAFTLGTPSVTLPASLAAGASLTLPVTFNSSGNTTQTDVLAVTYTTVGSTSPVLTATDDISASQSPSPCTLVLAPTSINFNTVNVGTPVTQSITLTNTGESSCQVSGIALAATSDSSFSLAAGQPLALAIPAQGSAQVGVTVSLANSKPPLTRKGTLDFQSDDPSQANGQVPLLASIATPYAGGGAWPRWHHDNIQNGLSASDTSWLTGKVAWTFPVSVPTNNFFTNTPTDYLNSPVVGTDGTVYQLGMNGTLYAVNPDGGQQWATALEGPVVDPHPGTPIIESDGNLFVAYGDTTVTGLANGLYHVSSTGTVLSAIPPEGDGDGFDLPPMLTNGGLLLGADEVAGAFAFTINANGTFTVADSASIRADFDQFSAVVGSDDSTYWCGGGSCSALSPPPTFALEAGWPLSPGTTQSSTSDLALDEANTGNLMIVMGGWSVDVGNGSQQLLSVNPQTGATVWSVTLPAATPAQDNSIYIGFADATTGNSCPAIGADGTVYVGNFDGLHAFDGATGTEKPGFPFKTSADVLTAPAIGGDGTIFIGTLDGTFYAVNPDGTKRFQLTAGGRVAGSPAIGPSGAVYFTANDGLLYAVN